MGKRICTGINPLTLLGLLSDFTFCCLVHKGMKALQNQRRQCHFTLWKGRTFPSWEEKQLAWEDNFSNKEIAQYLSNPPSFVIYQERPANCERNAVCEIDWELVASDDNLNSDHFSQRNNGTMQAKVSLGKQTYVLIKTYFVHRKKQRL